MPRNSPKGEEKRWEASGKQNGKREAPKRKRLRASGWLVEFSLTSTPGDRGNAEQPETLGSFQNGKNEPPG